MTADDRNAVELIKEAWGAYEYDEGTGWDLVSRLATALEDAVMRIAELEDERDAALAAVERVHEAVEKHKHWNDGCGWDVPTIEVLAALDGAPEPEGAWEYRARTDYGRVVAQGSLDEIGHLSGHIWERRRKSGPWLPVEGESK